MSIKKRYLADIHPDHYRQFEKIQQECERRGEVVPTIPYLIRIAIDAGMRANIELFNPARNERKVSAS